MHGYYMVRCAELVSENKPERLAVRQVLSGFLKDKNKIMDQNFRTKTENIIIALLALVSAAMLVSTLMPGNIWASHIQEKMEMGKSVERVFSLLMLIVCGELKKRKRGAWTAAVIICIINILRDFAGYSYGVPVSLAIVSALMLGFLIYTKNDFCCPSSRASGRRAVLLLVVSAAGVLINAGLSYHFMKTGISETPVLLSESFANGIGLLFGVGESMPGGKGMQLFESFICAFSWICIIAAVLYAVRPWLAERKSAAQDIRHARTLLDLYSQNPVAYLTLEDDKELFFGEKVDGVIAYGVVGDTIVVNGDPVCADEDFPELLKEFCDFADRSAHKLFIMSVTDHFIEEYKKQGFGSVKSGEEARFDLDEYEISGKKGQKMRMNINHAKNAGVTVKEYKVHEHKDPVIEAEFDRVSAEWLEDKKSSLLRFTLGSVGLDDPMGKRYFYAENADGKIVAFVVYIPFMGTSGYMADVTRHGKDAPGGVMEYINYQAFQVFKEEGYKYGSLGVAPLAGLDPKSSNPIERMLCFVYAHLNDCYGFRDLHTAKKNYSPNEWLPSYYVYRPSVPTPDMFYAVVRIQNPQGMLDYVKGFFRSIKKRRR